MNSRVKMMVVTTSACLLVLLVLGAHLGKSADQEGAYRQLAVYTEVLHRIKSEYVEEPDLKSVTLGAVNGMLESIDPFASYLNAEQYKEYIKKKEAHKADLGLVLSKRFGYLGVVAALPGSPAAKAGLSTGDMVESIKGVATRDMPLAYAELLLKGDAGSTIELSVMRVRRPEPHKITLARSVLAFPAMASQMMPDQVGYLRPQGLSQGRVDEVAAAVNSMTKQGAKRILLDLRYCAVGSPEDGVALANLFLDKGLISYVQGQKVSRQDFQANPAKAVTRLPLAVLTNRGTASGAEVAAAALLDSQRAELVGERTYGDASIRRAVAMDDGSAVILSVAKYYSPSGKAIQDTGVTPPNLVAELDAQLEADEDSETKPDSPETPKKLEDDPLVKKAIELLARKS